MKIYPEDRFSGRAESSKLIFFDFERRFEYEMKGAADGAAVRGCISHRSKTKQEIPG